MRIIIAGAGEVGFHLAKLLAYENHDITVIDKDKEKLEEAANYLDVATIQGNASYYNVLFEAGVTQADLLIAVTTSEEANIATCIIGKNLGAKKTIARVENVEFIFNKEKFDIRNTGIDELISPESLAAREIKRLLRDVGTTDSFDFDNGKLSLVGTVLEPNNVLVGKKINELEIQGAREDFNAVAILRNNETIIPHGNTSFESGDHAYFIAPPGGIDNIMHIFGKKKTTFKSIMLLGGSKVGYHTAVKLSKKFNVKLIEKDKQKCFELADKLPDVMVINGDGRDVELLKEEGIEEMDAFIAVTGNSETNILSCLVAKNHNVKKTISLVENIDYIHLSQNIGVDTMINKKLIAANFIFRYVREGEVISLTSIHGVDAEVLEFIVKPGSKITESFIKDLHFPPNAIIGGVVRNGMGYTTKGDFQFRPGDRAVVLSKPSCLYKVEEFFK